MAGKFRFRLQKLLDLRDLQEKQIALELTEALAKVTTEQSNLKRLRMQRNDLMRQHQMSVEKSDRIRLRSFQVVEASLAQIDREMGEVRRRIREAEAAAKKVRQKLKEARQAKLAVEKLRERQEAEAKSKAAKAARQQADEIAIRTFNQMRQEKGTK